MKRNGKETHVAHVGAADAERMSEFFKAIADKTRIKILLALFEHKLCVMHIAERVGMSQSATSHQLAILKEADFVRVEKSGKQNVYSISDEHVRLMIDMAILHLNEKESCDE